MNKANIILGVGVVVALVLGVWAVTKTPSQNTVREVVREVGAMPGSSLEGPEFCVSGSCSWNQSGSLKIGTTTPLALKSAPATTTLLAFNCDIKTASSTATVWDFARATSAFATTTAIGTPYTVAASASAFIMASTTQSVVNNEALVFPPNTYLVVGVRQGFSTFAQAAAGATSFAPVGKCAAVWRY
jgi:hypothetical protein